MLEKEKTIVEKIKASYSIKEQTKLDELKALDKKVNTPATVFAYIFGSIACLILGVGMCLAMKIIGSYMALGVIIGVVGIALLFCTYPIYTAILKKRKEKYSKRIFELSDSLLNENND